MGKPNPSPQTTVVQPQIPESQLEDQLQNQGQAIGNATAPVAMAPWTPAQVAGEAAGRAPQNTTPTFGAPGTQPPAPQPVNGAAGQPSMMLPNGGQPFPQTGQSQWWDNSGGQPQAVHPPTQHISSGGQQAMAQNATPSLAALGALLGGKGAPNPGAGPPQQAPPPGGTVAG